MRICKVTLHTRKSDLITTQKMELDSWTRPAGRLQYHYVSNIPQWYIVSCKCFMVKQKLIPENKLWTLWIAGISV
jgi:hypothetical protein